MACSVLERNTPFSLKEKIIEKPEPEEVDSYLQLTTAPFIVKNGWGKSNAPFMKTPLVVNQKLLV